MPDPRLPILDIADELVRLLRAGNRLVLSAPTGSGKTTQVPQIIHRAQLTQGRIVVLQPRRLATRMMAQRVAVEMGCRLGDLVGYQTRHDSQVSDATLICFMTEGLFLRQMQAHRKLPGVGVVLLDEFHERSLAMDTVLALLRALQEGERRDLKLVVMSATLDVQKVRAYLGCPALEAGGRLFPVQITHIARRSTKSCWDQAAAALGTVPAESETGDVLIFMPGAYEIRRTIAACKPVAGGAVLYALHGQMPPQEQDAVLGPSSRRKVIVATNVAETSLTIPGVTHVIDSGLARVNRYDPRRGINVLLIEPISQASAQQRAGRAGRTAPGSCIRLWPENEHRSRPAHTPPEVLRLDLAEVMLQLASLGVADPRKFPWLEPPEELAIERGQRLLRDLDAIGPDGSLTELGRTMAMLPMHPRLARMLVAAAERECLHRAALWAALVSEREILIPGAPSRFIGELGPEPASDFLVLERAIDAAAAARFVPERCAAIGVHGQACREVVQTHRLYLNACRRAGLDVRERSGDVDDVIRCLLTGFVDHLAVRRGEGNLSCTLADKRRGVLDKASVVHHASLVLPVDVREVGAGTGVKTVLSLASRVDPAWLRELFPGRVATRSGNQWNADVKGVEKVERVLFDDLVLSERVSGSPDPDAAAAILVDLIVRGDLKLERWDDAVEQWMVRTRCVGRWFPERKLLNYDESDRRVILLEICSGASRYSQIKDQPCLEAVKNALSWDDQRFVEQMAPERISLPGARGWKMKVEYPIGEGQPKGRAKIQDLYGLTQSPRVAGGRQVVLLEILGPNFRPVQVTEDLAGFWKNLYPKLRQELSRKYPRHEWR